jgi:hypothetical protein
VLFLFGHMRDFYRKKIWGGRAAKKQKEGYAPIRQDYEVRRRRLLASGRAGGLQVPGVRGCASLCGLACI